MNRIPGMRAVATVGLVGLLAGILLTGWARADASVPPLGAMLPALTLRTADGRPVLLSDRLAHGPALIIVLGPKDCFSCSSYDLELRILKSRLPGITPILIGSGPDEQIFRDYFRHDHLEAVGLLDRDRSLLTSLGVRREPLVLLADSTGRILFVDDRPGPAAAQFPFGRLLPLLGGALHPTLTLKTGDTN